MYRRLFIMFGWLLVALSAQAQDDSGGQLSLELVAETRSVAAGRPFWLAINAEAGSYDALAWRMAGSALPAPEFNWTLPEGYRIGQMRWPAPSSRALGEGERVLVLPGPTTLLVEVIPPDKLEVGRSVVISLRANWHVCLAKCVSRTAGAMLFLPQGSGQSDPASRDLFVSARTQMPVYSPWPVRARAGDEEFRLTVFMDPGESVDIDWVAFFSFNQGLMDLDRVVELDFEVSNDRVELWTPRPPASDLPERIQGLFVFYREGGEDQEVFEVDVENIIRVPGESFIPLQPVDDLDLTTALLFAFFGGLILNLMPCVFPILALKAFSIARGAGLTSAERRTDGLAYTAGVITSFFAIAALLLILKGLGAEVGWGFQLQSLGFVTVLVFLLSAVTLSFAGLFELRARFAGIGQSIAGQKGPLGSYFTGVLAVVVASPCTAPFMAPAIGFALVASPAMTLGVFLALGFGMALPFLILGLLPAVARALPKPGPWMVRFRQVLALPLGATVLWLVWVLFTQAGSGGLYLGVGAVGLTTVGAIAYRYFPDLSGVGRRAVLPLLVVLAALFGTVYGEFSSDRTAAAQGITRKGRVSVLPFSMSRLASVHASGRPVFLYFTASWCITCLVNDKLVLDQSRFQDFLLTSNIVLMEGNWTNPNPEIARYLADFGRSGIPFNIFYPGGPGSVPVVLPEFLNLEDTIQTLEKALAQ